MTMTAIDSKFQIFSVQSETTDVAKRLNDFRKVLKQQGVDAFMVPRGDEFKGEYVPSCSERLAFITGFTGSAGFSVIKDQGAALFIDGRYTVQAREQVDAALFEQCDLFNHPPAKWMRENLAPNSTLGFDPWLHSISEIKALKNTLAKKGITLKPMDENPIDQIWHDQPAIPLGKVKIQELEYAGQLARDKLSELADKIKDAGADHYLINDTTSVAWAFNIRGEDVPHTPVALSFAMLSNDGNHKIFIHEEKLSIETRAYLTQICDIHSIDAMEGIVKNEALKGSEFLLDPKLLGQTFATWIEDNGGKMQFCDDLVSLPRAIKNEAEIKGSRAAHIRDGVAMARFLHWLDSQPVDELNEIYIAKRLEQFRIDNGDKFSMPLLDVSFDTISASGVNAPLCHYRVSEISNRQLSDNEIYLIDSGGQYQDGTTDITRTVAIGEPTAEMKRQNTLVLKGHIAIDQLRFPKGTNGAQIDILARHALWQAGFDFAHGTGHGVGSYLSVHEGPQGIAKRYIVDFQPGMIVSNEPGYYKEGQYGIRIENIILVTEPEPIAGGEIEMMGFECLSFTPIDKRLIDKSMMSDSEVNWLNVYHQNTFDLISPYLEGDALVWLKQATSAL